MDPTTLALLQGGAGLLGGILGAKEIERTRDDIRDFTNFRSQSLIGPFGTAGVGANGTNTFQFGAEDQLLRGLLTGSSANLLGGGLFNDPNLQAAFANNDIAGALNQANSALGTQASSTAFGGLGGLFSNAQGLSNAFSQAAANGPVDQSGGLQANLFARGTANQNASTNQQGLFNQFLNTQRAAAEPQNTRAFNDLENRLFAQGRLGSTGGSENIRGFFEALNQQDLNFQNNAFGLANNQRDFLAGLGNAQIGQGIDLLGQNLSQANTNANLALGFGNQAAALEGQGFNQLLGALGQNQNAGLQRLNAAQGLFGLGTDTFSSQFGLGLGAGSQFLSQNELALNTILGLRNAEANRIGATAGGSNALSNVQASSGGFLSSLVGGLFG